jgi:uncharacterized membrane protein YcaP (DUF421 family)
LSLSDFLIAVFGSSKDDMVWWHMCLRAVVVFVFGLLLVRLFARRAFGEQTPLDIIVAIIIGSNLSRAMTGNAPFLSTLAATVALVLVFWILGHAAVRWHGLGRLVKGQPKWLTGEDGRLDAVTMRRSGVTRGDVEEAARSIGLAGMEDVAEVVFERNGRISTVKRKGG